MDNAVKLTSALIRNGWSLNVMHEEDSAGNPFVNVQAVKRPHHVYVTWHTRHNQGKYRLHTCLVNERDSTLTKALEFIKGGEPVAT